MDRKELLNVILGTLKSIAPEVEVNDLAPDKPLRDQVDLDSMDWLNFLVALHEKLMVEIPEADYQKLVTLNNVVDYLAGKVK